MQARVPPESAGTLPLLVKKRALDRQSRRLKLELMEHERKFGLWTMTAYGGTYKFDGTTVEHNIDIAWNEVWAGTQQVRTVTRDGDRLTLTTSPFPFHTDGKISVNMLVWERVK
jgi:hypothetical protein